MISPGLCCINNSLQGIKPPVKTRVLQRKGYDVQRAIETGRENIRDLMKHLRFNAHHKITLFRISSELLPRFTDRVVQNYSMDHFDDLFKEAGALAKATNQRLTFHPGQFTVLSTSDPRILQASIDELVYHAECLARMGVDSRLGVVNIHGGGLYGLPKDVVKQTWAKNYNSLPAVVRQYLTIENDERSYCLQDCLDISALCGVPVVYDTHHEECYRASHPDVPQRPIIDMLDEVIASWGTRLPLAHISNQKPGARPGAHSDFIERVPKELWAYAERVHGGVLHVDIEAKAKEAAVLRLRALFKERITGHTVTQVDLSYLAYEPMLDVKPDVTALGALAALAADVAVKAEGTPDAWVGAAVVASKYEAADDDSCCGGGGATPRGATAGRGGRGGRAGRGVALRAIKRSASSSDSSESCCDDTSATDTSSGSAASDSSSLATDSDSDSDSDRGVTKAIRTHGGRGTAGRGRGRGGRGNRAAQTSTTSVTVVTTETIETTETVVVASGTLARPPHGGPGRGRGRGAAVAKAPPGKRARVSAD